jgi:hypothetical protein
MSEFVEIVLPRRVIPQPVPHKYPGGDCVACVTAGVTGLSIEEVYEIAKSRTRKEEQWRWSREGKNGYDSLSNYDVEGVLWEAKSRGLIDNFITEVPIWPFEFRPAFGDLAFGMPGRTMVRGWIGYVRMALEAGYYGLTGVNYRKTGDLWTDHWVMLCGFRTREVPIFDDAGKKLGSKIQEEVLVSCSARTSPDEEWVEIHRDFLAQRGGFAMMLARPSK